MKIEKFLEFEEKYDLFNREVIGEYYWEYCRIFMFFFIQSFYDNTSNIINLKPPKPCRKLSLSMLSKYFLRGRKCDILFVSDPRRYMVGDTYINTFCDPVSSTISDEYKTLTLEEPAWVAKYDTFPPHFTPTNDNDLIYVDIYEHEFVIKKWLYHRLHKRKINKIEEELKYIFSIIHDEFGVDISFSISEFTDIILYNVLMRKIYIKLISKISPKVIIINYRPTYFKTLIIGVCKDMGIPVVELQHGSINKDEPMNRKLHPRSYERYFADYIFCFGKKLVVSDYIIPRSLKYVGYPFLEYVQSLCLEKPKIIEDGKKYILVISQSTIGDQLSEFTSALSVYLSDRPEYIIIFKYHPNETGRNYPCLDKKNIIQIKELDNYVTQYHKYAYCQIGVYSTAIYEGLRYLLPTIIVDNLYNAQMLIGVVSHITKGIYYVKDAATTYSIIDSLRAPSPEDIKTLWEDNAILNTQEEIRAIIENNGNESV